MASSEKSLEPTDSQKPSRQYRVGRYKVWLLQKRFAELSTQVEASVLEARQLIAWKQSCQPLVLAELTDDDKRLLEHNHRIRLAEVVQKHCSGALKSITQHKWAFPFNSPVDVTRFPDYPKVISCPMDFSTIKARQDNGYYREPKEWLSDVMLVFSNAKRYNAPGSDCYLMAQTLQEVSEEKYDKVITPRLVEETAAMQRDELHLRKKRAELLNQQISDAMDAHCAVLFNLMAELHASIREAKSLASSLCEPLTLEEKQALAATIQGLPTAQLEAIVSFIASRHPPSLSQSEVLPGSAGGVPSRRVQLNLGRYEPLLLRQLQHLVSTCTAAQQQQHPQRAAPGVPPASGIPARLSQPQRVATLQPAPAGADKVRTEPRPGSDRGTLGSQANAGQPTGVGPAVERTTEGGVRASGVAQQSQAAAAGDTSSGLAAQPQQAVRSGTSVVGGLEAAAGQVPQSELQQGVGAGATTQPSAAAAGPGAVVSSPGKTTPALSSTQRNIADVVSNPSASGVSIRAGIKWPGLAVGAGVRPRARALLSLYLDGPASAAEVAASCPLPQPVPPPEELLTRPKRKRLQPGQANGDEPLAVRRRAASPGPTPAEDSAPQASASKGPANGPHPRDDPVGGAREDAVGSGCEAGAGRGTVPISDSTTGAGKSAGTPAAVDDAGGEAAAVAANGTGELQSGAMQPVPGGGSSSECSQLVLDLNCK